MTTLGLLIEQAASLSAYARRLTGSGGADADDLLQETMLRCWVARRSFVPDTNLGAWMRTVMRNSFLSGRRRAPFHADLPEDAFDRLLRSEEHTSELQSLMRISYAVFCLKKKISLCEMLYCPTTIP